MHEIKEKKNTIFMMYYMYIRYSNKKKKKILNIEKGNIKDQIEVKI